ncbi:MAG: Gfo/Idh/MocA family oxidoreductase [Chitinophagaceae bacterium]
MDRKSSSGNTNRRSFLKNTGTAVIGSSVAYGMGFPMAVPGAKKPVLKVGLVGCGGRGSGAALEALKADPNVVLTAMGDVFADRLNESYAALLEAEPNKVKVSQPNKFIGFDAFQKVIDSGVDVVLLTTPPCFRPDHFTAAVDAGKHVFCEKPVAVDAPGVRKVLAAAIKAKAKNLSVMSGFCFRRDAANRATFGKVLNGDIGNVMTVSSFRYGGELWYKPRLADWSDMTYKMRNWYYHNWLSGDFIVEQAVHSIDMMAWAMGDKMPVSAIGSGGRQVRIDDKYGNIYDHFAIEYEYANGAKGFHFCRQQTGCANRNTVDIAGTLGNAKLIIGRTYEITGRNPWKYTGEMNNMFQAEHDEFFASIRNGKAINDGETMANSTMLAILSRMVGYSGQAITWHDAIHSTQSLGPDINKYAWDLRWPTAPIARPGTTKVI